ncbi:arsenate reductase (glutaredoxin) [Glaciecola sp. SC05]|uniref:arsenate reductase (glutaredoxin) n=1 Tax=Glaciecola sp. SC05 TaxID=1987355 RepID=UPI003527F6F4
MPKAVLYHNPRCTKSREALAFLSLQISGLEVVEYLKTPLSKATLVQIFSALDIHSAHDMIRTTEAEYKLAKLSSRSTDNEILSAIEKYPKLLERPILVYGTRAAIGRPLDNIANLLNE